MRAERNDRATAVSRATKVLVCSLAVAASVGVAARAQGPAVVKVDTGELQGVVDDGVVSYKGIPFAAPPVGDLRWRPPSRRRGGLACGKPRSTGKLHAGTIRTASPRRCARAAGSV